MKTMAFVVWMIGFPLAWNIEEFLFRISVGERQALVNIVMTILGALIYFLMAFKLWNNCKDE